MCVVDLNFRNLEHSVKKKDLQQYVPEYLRVPTTRTRLDATACIVAEGRPGSRFCRSRPACGLYTEGQSSNPKMLCVHAVDALAYNNSTAAVVVLVLVCTSSSNKYFDALVHTNLWLLFASQYRRTTTSRFCGYNSSEKCIALVHDVVPV